MAVLRSAANPQFRRGLDLVRDADNRSEEGVVLVEGPHLVQAAREAGARVRRVIVAEGAASGARDDGLLAGTPAVIVADSLFRRLSVTPAPQGIAAEVELPPQAPSADRLSGCVMLDAVQDAGNVGTILRSAAAFGGAAVLLGEGCADPWSPKVLRAAAGAHFRLSLRSCADLAVEIRAFGARVACAVPREGIALDRADLSGRLAWLFGSEGRGVAPRLAALAPLRVSIPMRGGSESINVAAAAAVCLYEAARPRA
jgi:TrmH family RNA methyltransferase